MLYRTHIVISLFFLILFLPSINGDWNKLVFIFIGIISAILPDIDSSKSKIGHNVPSRILLIFSKHRHFFHSFLFCLILYLVFYFFIPVISLPFIIGYGVHLISDALTRSGIMPFYPLSHFRIRFLIKTNSFIEGLLFLLFCFMNITLLIILRNKIL